MLSPSRHSIRVDWGTLKRKDTPGPGSLPPTFRSSLAPWPCRVTMSNTVRLFLEKQGHTTSSYTTTHWKRPCIPNRQRKGLKWTNIWWFSTWSVTSGVQPLRNATPLLNTHTQTNKTILWCERFWWRKNLKAIDILNCSQSIGKLRRKMRVCNLLASGPHPFLTAHRPTPTKTFCSGKKTILIYVDEECHFSSKSDWNNSTVVILIIQIHKCTLDKKITVFSAL